MLYFSLVITNVVLSLLITLTAAPIKVEAQTQTAIIMPHVVFFKSSVHPRVFPFSPKEKPRLTRTPKIWAAHKLKK